MYSLRCILVIVLLAIGCGKPSPPPRQIQAWVESWAKMGMYLPDGEQIAFLRANLRDVELELAAALSHTNLGIRQRAAYVIGEIGTDAVPLGPALLERLEVEPNRVVRFYIADALAAVKYDGEEVIALLRLQFESLGSENAPPQLFGGYAEVDERINLASALFVLTKGNERKKYLDFVIQWLNPLNAELNPIETAGYWERRWIAVISLEGMHDAKEAIPLLESMLGEEDSKSWVSVHVPRVIGVLKQ